MYFRTPIVLLLQITSSLLEKKVNFSQLPQHRCDLYVIVSDNRMLPLVLAFANAKEVSAGQAAREQCWLFGGKWPRSRLQQLDQSNYLTLHNFSLLPSCLSVYICVSNLPYMYYFLHLNLIFQLLPFGSVTPTI